MKSGQEGVKHEAAKAFALTEGWVGSGWGLNGSDYADQIKDGCTDVQTYLALAAHRFPQDASLAKAAKAIAVEMASGDICWTYDPRKGEYWCGKVTGDFVYRQGGMFDEYDLHLLRPCRWALAGTADAIPGAVRRGFAGPFGAVTQLTTDKERIINAARYALGEPNVEIFGDLFEAASPEDLEDLVALFLQDHGWRLLPSTSKTSMASYEFVVVESKSGRRAGVQVKSGNVSYLEQAVAEDFDSFFVFLAGKNPRIIGDHKAEIIDRENLRRFALNNLAIIPKRLAAVWAVS
ncbi:hypothetical protein QP166_05150 [Sphingomonas sp. LR60]|uniref:hypothetical protein n=1 Tax=Sphingomonas sp. LR60 TaxID=3050233 RepID=UPI002FE069B9